MNVENPLSLTDEDAEAFHRVISGKDDQERMLLAGAKAYAKATYSPARDEDGNPMEIWDALHDSDKAACMHKAKIVLRGAGVIR